MKRNLKPRPHRPRAATRFLNRWPLLVPLVSLLAASPALALTPEVKDDAQFFTPSAVQKTNEAIKDIKRRFQKDLLIETFKTVPSERVEKVNALDRSARNDFFHAWANDRARKAGVNGIYILITKQPGHAQVEVGAETQKKAFTLRDRDRLRGLLVDAFKRKDYDKGLLDAVQFVQRSLSDNLQPASNPKGVAAAPINPRPAGNLPGPVQAQRPGMGWLVWVVLIVVGVWLFVAFLRAFGRTVSGGGGGGGGYGYGGGGGGGFFSGMLGGLFGAAAGNWLYDSFFRGGGHTYAGETRTPTSTETDEGRDYSGAGGDFDDPPASGGDSIDAGGGESDFGGSGDLGGGGDFGAADAGGGGDF